VGGFDLGCSEYQDKDTIKDRVRQGKSGGTEILRFA